MSRKLLVASLVGCAAIVAVALGVPRTPVVHRFGVGRFLKEPVHDVTVRLRGRLVKASLCRTTVPCGYRFGLSSDSDSPGDAASAAGQVAVHYAQCSLPDTFRELPGLDFEIEVEGELCGACHIFEAQRVMVWTGKFEPITGAYSALPIPECGG